MKSSKKTLLTRHPCMIGLLFLLISVLLLLTGTVPATTTDLIGYFNLFMYFLVILALTSGCYFFIRLRIYAHILRKIQTMLSALREPAVRKQLLLDIAAVAIILLVSFFAESFYSRYIIGAPNSLGTYFNRYRFLFIIAVLSTLYTLFRFRRELLLHTERAFLIIALISGLLMTYCGHTNTCVCWDDHIHFNTANSMIGLTEYTVTDMDSYFYDAFATENLMFSSDLFNMKVYKDRQQHYVNLEVAGSTTTADRSYTSFVQQICYLPAAFFLAIGKLLNFPFYLRYMFGKIGNLLVYSFVIYFGIKKLKSGKMLMAALALLPTNLFIAANYSYDYWVTSLSLFGFAYFYSEMQTPNEKLSTKNAGIMISALFLAFTPKAVYFPLLALLYFMPKKKFNNQKEYKRYLITVSLCIGYLLLSFVIPSVMSGPSTDLRGGENVSGAGQVSFILHTPLTYTKTLLTFLKNYLSVGQTQSYTTFLAYYGAGSKYTLITIAVILYAFLDKSAANRYSSKTSFRLFSVICCFCSVCLVATALYVAFTPVGLDTINGCQPRYLIPILFPFLYILGTSKTTGYFTKNWHYLLGLGISSYVLLATFWTTCIGLYY